MCLLLMWDFYSGEDCHRRHGSPAFQYVVGIHKRFSSDFSEMQLLHNNEGLDLKGTL